LGGNQLNSIPETIKKLTSLEYFNINHNRLKDIPEPIKDFLSDNLKRLPRQMVWRKEDKFF
jgi:Leucine-rich repeat (LRR) protein